jgi:lipoate-protein ligase A
MKRYEYKVPGGKLLCAKVETKDNAISFLQFTGDFFLLPETDLEALEKKLLGQKTDQEELKETIVSFFTGRKTTIAGAKPEDFAYVLNNAIKKTYF